MARYSAFLGRRVEVQYRAGDILLPASGTFVADSGRSIFLEQNFEQRGQHRHFRWEIPYQYIVRLQEKPGPVQSADPGSASASASAANAPAPVPEASTASSSREEAQNSASAAAAGASGGAPTVLPLGNRPKTA
jgi:hypothetical protein